MGAGWGMTIPLSKIAVSGGYQHFGLIFWQLVICSVSLGIVLAARGRWPKLTPATFRLFLLIALIGTILPNSASYKAAWSVEHSNCNRANVCFPDRFAHGQ